MEPPTTHALLKRMSTRRKRRTERTEDDLSAQLCTEKRRKGSRREKRSRGREGEGGD
jgi:hypothetical protein